MTYLWLILRRLLYLSTGLLLLLTMGLAYMRWTWSDERIARAVEALGQQSLGIKVHIGHLQLDLMRGLVLQQVLWQPSDSHQVAPLHIARVALGWRLGPLLRGTLALREMAIEGLIVHRQQGDGSEEAWQTLLQRWSSKPAANPMGDGTAKQLDTAAGDAATAIWLPAWPRPSLPVPIVIERIRCHVQQLRWQQASGQLELEQLQLLGHFSGSGQEIRSNWALVLGEPSKGVAAKLAWQSPQEQLQANVWLSLQVTQGALDQLQCQLSMQGKGQLTLATAAAQQWQVSSQQLAYLQPFSQQVWWQYGQVASDNGLQLLVEQIHITQLAQQVQLAWQSIALSADLTALSPWLSWLWPTWHSSGQVRLGLRDGALLYPVRLAQLPSWHGEAHAEQLAIAWQQPMAFRLAPSNLSAQWQVAAELGTMDVQGQLSSLELPSLRLQAMKVRGQGRLPLVVGTADPAAGELQVSFAAQQVAYGNTLSWQQLAGDFNVQAPFQLGASFAPTAAAPIAWQSKLTWQHVRHQQAQIAGLTQLVGGTAYRQQHGWALLAKQKLSAKQFCLGQLNSKPSTCAPLRMDGQVDSQVSADLVPSVLAWRGLQLQWGELLHVASTGQLQVSAQDTYSFAPCQLQLAVPSLKHWQLLQSTFGLGLIDLSGRIQLDGSWSGLLHPKAQAATWSGLLSNSASWSSGQQLEQLLLLWQQSLQQGSQLAVDVTLQVDKLALKSSSGLQVTAFAGQSHWQLAAHHAAWHQNWRLEQLVLAQAAAPLQLKQGYGALAWTISPEQIALVGQGEVAYPGRLPGENVQAETMLHMQYVWGERLELAQWWLRSAGMSWTMQAWVDEPLQMLLAQRWRHPLLKGVALAGQMDVRLQDPSLPSFLQGYGLTGAGALQGRITIADGQLELASTLSAEQLSLQTPYGQLSGMDGQFPLAVVLRPGRHADGFVLPMRLPLADGTMTLQLAGSQGLTWDLDYARIKAYRAEQRLLVRQATFDRYELSYVSLTGRLADGSLQLDEIAGHLLGGDVRGQLYLSLQPDKSVTGRMAVLISNMDASYFPALGLSPGADSELNADFALDIALGPNRRLLDITMHITKIGRLALDRCLRLLDPDGKDEKLRKNRENLRFVTIDNVSLWSKYDQLNIDVHYQPLLRIPWTQIGYRPIDVALLRRYSLSDSLDYYVQPLLRTYLAPALGW